ncbi:MAG: TIGR03546 family protein [Planctomycetes bacterium]|nr:TIGR03546 family protein [Planctomycetota bacterium]
MFSYFIAPVRRVIEALVSSDSSRQLAAGFTLGMIVGLLPKGNLIAISLCVAIFALRVNTGFALVAATLFSWVGPAIDPFAHKLGGTVLTCQPMQACYASLWNAPLGSWSGFNNTVVMGSLCIGLYFAYPVYWACLTSCETTRPTAAAWANRFLITGRSEKHEAITERESVL